MSVTVLGVFLRFSSGICFILSFAIFAPGPVVDVDFWNGNDLFMNVVQVLFIFVTFYRTVTMLPTQAENLDTTNTKTCRVFALARAGIGTRKRQTNTAC